MKSVIKGNVEDKQEELVFPVLMEWIGDGMFVVLFTDNTSGVVVHSKNYTRYIGEVRDDWAAASRSILWKKFTGTIELSN